MERECFSCGATQVDLAERELAPPGRHVRLCDPCVATFREAGLLADETAPSDFALRLSAALDSPAPRSSPPSG